MTTLHRALAVVILLTACAPRDARFDPSHFTLTGAGAPPDVVLPADAKPGSAFGGLKTMAPSEDGFCCVAGASLDLPVRKSGPAMALILGVYLEHAARAERLRITFPDGAVRSIEVKKEKFSTTRVALPTSLRARTGAVRIRIDANRAPYTLTSIYFV